MTADAERKRNGPVFMSCSRFFMFNLIYELLLMQDMPFIKFDDGRAGSGHYCIALHEDTATEAGIIE